MYEKQDKNVKIKVTDSTESALSENTELIPVVPVAPGSDLASSEGASPRPQDSQVADAAKNAAAAKNSETAFQNPLSLKSIFRFPRPVVELFLCTAFCGFISPFIGHFFSLKFRHLEFGSFYTAQCIAYSLGLLFFLTIGAVQASWLPRIAKTLNEHLGSKESDSKLFKANIFPPFLYGFLFFLYCALNPVMFATGPIGILHPEALVPLIIATVIHLPFHIKNQFAKASRLLSNMDNLEKTSGCKTSIFAKLSLSKTFIIGSILLPALCLQNFGGLFDAVELYLLIQVCLTMAIVSSIKKQMERLKNPLKGAKQFLLASMPGEELYSLGFRKFAKLERWWKQRMSSGSKWKTVFTILIVLIFGGWMAVSPTSITGGLVWIISLFSTKGAAGPGGPAPGLHDPYGALSFIYGVELLIVGIVFFLLSILIASPKSLLLSKSGLAFEYGFLALGSRATIPWSDLTAIDLERPAGKTTTFDDRLILRQRNDNDLIIPVECLPTAEDKEALLAAFDRFAGNVPRTSNVTEALSPSIENSYTELWLQALAAPPKRERLKPLITDAELNDHRYVIRKELGVGGQGFAYLAKDKNSGAEVVLKEFVLPVFVDINARKQALDRFEKEARLLTQLDHPQVVKLTGFFVEDHRAYLALEHIDGRNLRQIVAERGPLPELEVNALAEQMKAILIYLHGLSQPLVHRDFTPDNLILHKDGTLKLIDFNVAQQVESATTGTVVGKQAYLPPEQFRGQATTKSDIYAMGATLYFLLTGKDPVPISQSSPKADMASVSDRIDQTIRTLTAIDEAERPEADQLTSFT